MQLKTDVVYRTKEGKKFTDEKEKFNEVTVVSYTDVFVILKSKVDEEESATKREAFERVYEEKPLEALDPKEKIGHIFKKASYALAALRTLVQTHEKLAGEPNLTIINNTLHEMMLLSSPVPTSLTQQFEASLMVEETAPAGMDFLEIEDEVA